MSDLRKTYVWAAIITMLSLPILCVAPQAAAADRSLSTQKAPEIADQYTPDFPGPSLTEIMRYRELEKLTINRPSGYGLRDAPSFGYDPTWSTENASTLRSINSVDRKIGQDMRRLNDGIRRMNTSINRTRSIQRSRSF